MLPWLPESETYMMELYKNGMCYAPHIETVMSRYKGLCFELGAGYGLNCFKLINPELYYGVEEDGNKFNFLKLNSKHHCCKDPNYLPDIKEDNPLKLLIVNQIQQLYQLFDKRKDIIDYILKNKVPIVITINRCDVKEWTTESLFYQLATEAGYYTTRITGDCYLFKTISHPQ